MEQEQFHTCKINQKIKIKKNAKKKKEEIKEK